MSTEILVRATRDQISEFKKSILWRDFVRELTFWKSGARREMASIVENAADTNPSTASVLLHMGDVNGRIKAVDYMLALPDIFLQALELKETDNERED